MAGNDMNEATSSTRQSDVTGNQANQDSATSKPTVLSNARKLVESKTRFEPDDLQHVQEAEQLQSYEITARHHLIAEPTIESITGHFTPASEDLHTQDPVADAQKEVATQLRTAAKGLQAALAQPKQAYNQIEPGLLLKHPHKHWLLKNCRSCGGLGDVRCDPCHGSGKERCSNCGGSRTVDCYDCGGKGRKSRQVPRQVSLTTYDRNGQPYTSYHTEYDTQWYRCPSPSCIGGRIPCPTCRGTGETKCSHCNGSGRDKCNPCDGSGQVGTAAWVDVQVAPDYSYELPNETPPDVIEIAKSEGLHGLPPISEHFQFVQALIQPAENPEVVTASYLGNFKVVRQEVICEGESAHLVAYGRDLRWWTLDGIIERLLQDDLKALSSAIVESANEGLFSSKTDDLLDKLKHVAASEINVDIVEAALADKEFTEHKGAVSAEYAKDVKHGIQVTLRRIYVRTAKSFAWKTVLATLISGLGVWAFEGAIWAGISVAAVLLLSFLLHRRSIRNLLTDVLGTPEFAQRAMKVASKGSGGREAALLLSLPSVALALGIGWALPKQPPLGHKGADHSISSTFAIGDPIPRETNSQPVNEPRTVEQSSTAIQNPVAAAVEQNQKSNPAPQADKRDSSNSLAMQSNGAPQQAHSPRLDEPSGTNSQADAKLDTHSESDLRIAENMLSAGNYGNAYELAKRVLAKHPDNVRATSIARSAQSGMQRSQGKSLGNVPSRTADSSTSNSPTDAKLAPRSETQLRIAERMLNDGFYNNAYDLAKRVLANHPDNARALHILSSAQSEMGRSQGK